MPQKLNSAGAIDYQDQMNRAAFRQASALEDLNRSKGNEMSSGEQYHAMKAANERVGGLNRRRETPETKMLEAQTQEADEYLKTVQSERVRNFIAKVLELSIQEGLAISHEDFQGKFIIGELRGPKDLNHFKFAADHSHGSPIKE